MLWDIKTLKSIRQSQSKPLPAADVRHAIDAQRKAATPNRQPDLQAALKYVRQKYNVPVMEIDGQTLGMMWESGPQAKFEALKAKLKADFGVDAKITAVE